MDFCLCLCFYLKLKLQIIYYIPINMAPYSKSPTQQRLNNLITQTRTIIKQIKKEHSRNNKLFLILDYFHIITNYSNFKLVAKFFNENHSLSKHFASVNTTFANKLHSEFILSGFFHTQKLTPINETQFSDFLSHIIDLYGFQIKYGIIDWWKWVWKNRNEYDFFS